MSPTTRERLGVWRFRTGNAVDVFFSRDDAGHEHLHFEWRSPPPLSRTERRAYERIVLPAVIRRLQEFTERPGRAVVAQV